MILTAAGRAFAIHGNAVRDDTSALSDIDLTSWGRGEVDYLTGELLETIDAKFARVATTRREVLDFLLQEGVITTAEVRQDV